MKCHAEVLARKVKRGEYTASPRKKLEKVTFQSNYILLYCVFLHFKLILNLFQRFVSYACLFAFHNETVTSTLNGCRFFVRLNKATDDGECNLFTM